MKLAREPPAKNTQAHPKTKANHEREKKLMSERSAEETLLNSIFTPAEWVPADLAPSNYCSLKARNIIEKAPTDVRNYLLVNDPEEALDLFMEMSTGWAEGSDHEDRPCCEEDLECIADKFLLSRERTSYRADAWSIAAECEHDWDWDWFPRTYVKNKVMWLANAFESLKTQGLTLDPDTCERHRDLTPEEREIARKVVEDILKFYSAQQN